MKKQAASVDPADRAKIHYVPYYKKANGNGSKPSVPAAVVESLSERRKR